MRLRLKKPSIKFRTLLFILMIFVYCITSSDSEGNVMSKLKYVLLIGAIVYEWLYYRTNSNDYLKKEYARLFVMVILISLYSVLKSAMALHFSTRTIEELAFMVCPMLYTKLIIILLEGLGFWV